MASLARVFDPKDGNPNYTVEIVNDDGDPCMIVCTPHPDPGGYPSFRCVAITCPHDCTLKGPTIIYNPATGEKAWEEWVCECVAAG